MNFKETRRTITPIGQTVICLENPYYQLRMYRDFENINGKTVLTRGLLPIIIRGTIHKPYLAIDLSYISPLQIEDQKSFMHMIDLSFQNLHRLKDYLEKNPL